MSRRSDLSIDTEDDLIAYKRVLDKAQAIATKWVKESQTGDNAVNVSIVWLPAQLKQDPYISFSPRYNDGGVMWNSQGETLSLRYLDDDSSLVFDARAWKKAEMERSIAAIERQRELEQAPDVVEYKKLTDTNWWGWDSGHPLRKKTPKP